MRAETETPSVPALTVPPTLQASSAPAAFPAAGSAAVEERTARIEFRFRIPGLGYIAGELARIFRRRAM